MSSSLVNQIMAFPILSFFMILFSTTINGNSVKSPPSPCASFDCGNGLIVSYPFWQENQGQHPTFCGHPNLAVTCINGRPTFEISNNHYILKNYSIPHNTVTVISDQVIDSTCPIITHGFPDPLVMNYTRGDKIVHFYYNCTAYPPSASNIKCLQRGAKHSYAFVHGSEPDQFDPDQYCENVKTLPVIEGAVDELVGNGSMSGLRQGFELTWKTNDRLCQLCEASGGYCGYNSATSGVGQRFFCICGNYSHNCGGAGESVSTKPKPNYVTTGLLLALGGLSATCFIVYVVSKKKSDAQRGFTKIPSNQGK